MRTGFRDRRHTNSHKNHGNHSVDAAARPKSVFIHRCAVVERNAEIGAGTKIWHFCHVCKDASIGAGCVLGQNVFVASGVKIGNGCKIQNNVSVYSGVTLQDDIFIGPCATFTNIKNPRANINRKDSFVPTLVKQGATIGANATIVCGITIGRNAFIGAGAIVTKNVPDNAIVLGQAACVVGFISDDANAIAYGSGIRRVFDNGPSKTNHTKDKDIAKYI